MTTYNHEVFIAQAVNSILEQQADFGFEVVIGEDCSTDRTRQILLDLQASHPQTVRLLLRDQNAGGRKNLMDTYRSCTGEYVAWLEGDDFWTASDKLQKQADFLDSHSDFAMCFHRVLKRDETSGIESFAPAKQPASSRLTVRDLFRGNFIPTCSVMFRNNLFGGFPTWFSTTPSGDWPLHILNALHGDIGYIDEVMAVYRLHGGGVWSVHSPAAQKQRSIETLEILRRNLAPSYDRELAGSLAHWRIRLLYSISQEEGLSAALRRAPYLLMSPDLPKSTVLRAGLDLIESKTVGAFRR